MNQLGSPMPDAELEKELETSAELADRNLDGVVDVVEFVDAVEAKAAMSSERVGERPPKIVEQRKTTSNRINHRLKDEKKKTKKKKKRQEKRTQEKEETQKKEK